MKKFLLAATMLTGLASGANADLVRFDNPLQPNANCNTNCQSFVDIGGIGFGAAPRILTLHTQDREAGSSDPRAADGRTGDAIGGANKSDTPTLGSLNWGGASQVAIGFNTSQQGNSGLTLNDLTLNLFSASNTLVGSFSTAGTIEYTENDLDLQQGNGQGLYVYVLDANQRLAWNALAPTSDYKIGLFADIGCFNTSLCSEADGGPDSFLAIAGRTPIINPTCPDCTPVQVPGPVVGALLPSAMAGLGMLGFAYFRRRRQAA